MKRFGWALALAAGLALPTAARAQERGAPPRAVRQAPDNDLTLETAGPGRQEVLVGDLLEQWSVALDAHLFVDSQVSSTRVRVPASITWGETKALLEAYDVVVVEGWQGGHTWSVRAHQRRNLYQKEATPRVVAPDAIPLQNELVSVTFHVQHGQGNTIFATLRGLLSRDPNRLGNILYLPGPDAIVIVDLAPRVRHYAEVLATLDVPLASFAHQAAHRGAGDLSELLRKAILADSSLRGAVVVADPATQRVVCSGPTGALEHLRLQLTVLDVP